MPRDRTGLERMLCRYSFRVPRFRKCGTFVLFARSFGALSLAGGVEFGLGPGHFTEEDVPPEVCKLPLQAGSEVFENPNSASGVMGQD